MQVLKQDFEAVTMLQVRMIPLENISFSEIHLWMKCLLSFFFLTQILKKNANENRLVSISNFWNRVRINWS